MALFFVLRKLLLSLIQLPMSQKQILYARMSAFTCLLQIVIILSRYIRDLAAANDEERQQMLKSWIDDHGHSSAVRKSPHGSRQTRTSSADNFGEDEDDEHNMSLPPFSRRAPGKNPRPFKKLRLWTDDIRSVPMQDVADDEDDEDNSVCLTAI